jgi:hypothetical protein
MTRGVNKTSSNDAKLKSAKLSSNLSKKTVPSGVSELISIRLPTSSLTKGLSVPVALKKRCTVRSISDEKLPLQMLSNILWAASGINREKGPFGMSGRTSASASNSQEIDIYIALPEGIFLYDAPTHSIIPVVGGDFRKLAIGAGQKGAGTNAPVRLIYIVDLEKFKNVGFQEPGLQDPETQKAYYFVDTGLIAGNVYLYAASQGLGAWFHNCDKDSLAKALKLRPTQRILFGQTVGKPQM